MTPTTRMTPTGPRPVPVVAGVVGTATDSGVRLADVEITRPDLESVFLHVTGKALRN